MNSQSFFRRMIAATLFVFLYGFQTASAQESSSNPCVDLRPSDHALIIGNLEENFEKVISTARELGLDPLKRNPNHASYVLLSLIEVGVFEEEVRPTALAAQQCQSLIAEAGQDSDWGQALGQVSAALDRVTSPEEALMKLRELIGEVSNNSDIDEGLRTAAEIIEDGISAGIYNPQKVFFQELENGGQTNSLISSKTAADHAKELAVADGKGAFSGAAGGCAAGAIGSGVGCIPGALGGAVAGAVGNSALELIEKGWKYLGL